MGSEPSQSNADVFLEAMPDAVIVCSEDGVIRAANSRAAFLFDCDVNDLVGRPGVELALPVSESPSSGRSTAGSEIASLITLNGETFPAWIQTAPVQDGLLQATAIRGLSGSRSVTIDPEMSILETLSEGVLIANQEGVLTYVNRAGRQLIGLSERESSPISIREVFSESESAAETACGGSHLLDQVLLQGNSISHYEGLLSRGDRNPLEVSVNATPLLTSGGKPGGAIISFQDISRQKHAELQISIQKHVLDMIAEGKGLEETGAQIVGYLEHVVPETEAAIYQIDRDSGQVALVAAPGLSESVSLGFSNPSESSAAAVSVEALLTRQPLIFPGIDRNAIGPEFADTLTDAGYQAIWCYPVDAVANRSVGVICLYRTQPGAPVSDVQSLIDTAAGLLRIALDRVQIERELKDQSFNDDLTGLPNRILLLDRLDIALQRSAQSDHMVALLLLGIDRFQMVNNSMGYLAGDEFLRQVAERLRESVRSDDLVARFASDSFGILLNHISSETDAINVVMRIQRALAAPLSINGVDIYASISIGIALTTAPDLSTDTLVRYSDIALNRARESGQGQFAIFSPGQDLSQVPKIELQSRLHRALAADALELYYQPVISLRNQQVAGYEALIRWNDSQFGNVSPDDFLPLAQQAGIMSEITSWVLDRAVSQLCEWRTVDGREIFCAVNISPSEMNDSLLIEQVDAVLQRYDLDPRHLILEMTEQALIDTSGNPSRILDRLRASGVQIALDDFGTGYSSLSYLEYLDVDAIKIDRAFIQAARGGASRAPVAMAMVDLARRLGMRSVAEGVETEEDERVARQLGCDMAQGYYYGRPQPGTAISPAPRTYPDSFTDWTDP